MLNKLIPGYGLLAAVALSILGAFMEGNTDSYYVFVAFLLIIFGVWGGIMLIKKEEYETPKRKYTKRKK